jgi:hypothetical protein
MQKIISFNLVILFIVVGLTGCSKNTFQVRKNYQPRVKVEVNNTVSIEENGIVTSDIMPQSFPIRKNTDIPLKHSSVKIKKEKEPFMEKMADIFIPRKKELLRPVFHPEKKSLRTAGSHEGDDRTTGLIINLLALAFGIAAVLMVIGMVHGNVWVYFIIGLVLAIAAIIMGFIGKMMAWKAFGWLAGIIGILAVVLLLIFLLLVAVVHVAI